MSLPDAWADFILKKAKSMNTLDILLIIMRVE